MNKYEWANQGKALRVDITRRGQQRSPCASQSCTSDIRHKQHQPLRAPHDTAQYPRSLSCSQHRPAPRSAHSALRYSCTVLTLFHLPATVNSTCRSTVPVSHLTLSLAESPEAGPPATSSYNIWKLRSPWYTHAVVHRQRSKGRIKQSTLGPRSSVDPSLQEFLLKSFLRIHHLAADFRSSRRLATTSALALHRHVLITIKKKLERRKVETANIKNETAWSP